MKKHKKLIGFTAVALVFILVFSLLSIKKTEGNLDLVSSKEYDSSIVNSGISDITVLSENFTGMKYGSLIPAEDIGYENGRYAAKLDMGGSFKFSFYCAESAYYNIKIDYYITEFFADNPSIELVFDGNSLSNDLMAVPLNAMWESVNDEFEYDRFGNQIIPDQQLKDKWITAIASDYNYSSELPLTAYLTAGSHTAEVSVNGGKVYIGNFVLAAVSEILSYEEYEEMHKNAAAPNIQPMIFEAETPSYKNDTSIIPDSFADMAVTPYDTNAKLLNAVGGTWEKPGQALFYEINVQESGLYKIALNYKSFESNSAIYRKIELNGAVPFLELLHYPFAYNESFSANILGSKTEPFFFFMKKGINTLSISVDGNIYAGVRNELLKTITELDEFYIQLKKLVGSSSDANRDWEIIRYFPDIIADFDGYISSIDLSIEKLYEINQNTKNTSELAFLQSAVRSLRKLAEKPNTIPNNIAKLREGSGSIVQLLYNTYESLNEQPLVLDKIITASCGEEIKTKTPNIFVRSWESIKRFFASFSGKYKNKTDDDTIEVWMNRSRTQKDLVQKMCDADFTAKTGIKVNFSIMPDEGKLILASASGASPDVAIGISNFLPYELGIRNTTVDLTQFDDYYDIISQFVPGAMVNLLNNGRGFGLPETQDFYVMFYREDIMSSSGIKIPSTWADVIGILPQLQRNGMNFYLPLSGATGTKPLATTAPFIYQFGGSLYNEDTSKVTIDNPEAIQALKMLTEFYTLYGLDLTAASFFEAFRNGRMPIGISTFDTFLKLSIAAPELTGKWKIALCPGVEGSDGVVNRQQPGGGTSSIIFKSSKQQEKAWEFLKWWMSAAVQTDFMNRIRIVYGKEYLWNSANTEAFFNMPLEQEQKNIIAGQFEWLIEMPMAPGWYMIERELSNVWTKVVLEGENLRAAIDEAAATCNKETVRKMTEQNYMKNGIMIKPYHITTIEEIKRAIAGGAYE